MTPTYAVAADGTIIFEPTPDDYEFIREQERDLTDNGEDA